MAKHIQDGSPVAVKTRNTRIKYSCISCRARKVKCSRTFPCQHCTARHEDCVWVRDEKNLRPPGPTCSADFANYLEKNGSTKPRRRKAAHKPVAESSQQAKREASCEATSIQPFKNAELSSKNAELVSGSDDDSVPTLSDTKSSTSSLNDTESWPTRSVFVANQGLSLTDIAHYTSMIYTEPGSYEPFDSAPVHTNHYLTCALPDISNGTSEYGTTASVEAALQAWPSSAYDVAMSWPDSVCGPDQTYTEVALEAPADFGDSALLHRRSVSQLSLDFSRLPRYDMTDAH